MLFFSRLLCCLVVVLVAVQTGCQPSANDQPSDTSIGELEQQLFDPITMLFVDDRGEELGDLIARQWAAESGGELTVVVMTAAEFAEAEYEIPADVDVIIFPTPMLGELESRRAIKEFANRVWTSPEFNRAELLQIYRAKLVRHNNRNWAIPLGGPQFGLMHDREWLLQNEFQIPTLWEEFKRMVVSDFSDKEMSEAPAVGVSESETMLQMPLAEGWAAQMFLLRLAPMIRSRGRLSTVFDRDTMQPLINHLPFQVALEDLKKMMGQDLAQLEMTPADVYQNVLDGKVPLGITWLHPGIGFTEEVDESTDPFENKIGFADLPGDPEWYDTTNQRWIRRSSTDSPRADLIGFSGRLAAVSSQSRISDQAFEFLAWLGNKTTALKTIAGDATFGPFRASHLGDPGRWAGDFVSEQTAIEYANLIQAIQEQDTLMMFPRIPGYVRYLSALDHNIRRYLKSEIDSEQALQDTAQQWEQITEEIGRQKLILELRKDAGL